MSRPAREGQTLTVRLTSPQKNAAIEILLDDYTVTCRTIERPAPVAPSMVSSRLLGRPARRRAASLRLGMDGRQPMDGRAPWKRRGTVAARSGVGRGSQTGDEFILALTTVARQTPSEARDQGRDAALTSLRAAAGELSSIQKDDARLEQVVLLLDEASGKSPRAPSEPNQVFWF
jgi:hypothetical protein